MVKEFDILIKNARLRYKPLEKTYFIGVNEGKISSVSDERYGRGVIEVDAEGNLVSEPFANPHIHMCKVYTFLKLGESAVRQYQSEGMGGAMSAIEIASKLEERYDESWIYENARKAALSALKNGSLYLRAFVDTGTKARLEGIKALLKVKDELKHVMKIQVVAFPQDGFVRDKGAEEYVRKAMELGADVVGGIPWIELVEEDEIKHIRTAFEIAKEFNKDIAMLTDDAGDPELKTTIYLARTAIKEGWRNRVTACHARALSTYPKPTLLKTMELSKSAGISYVTDPHTGPLYLPFKEMIKAGVNVALGQDDIADAYYPYGKNSMLEVAFLASHVTWSMTLRDMDTFMDMITWRGMRAMGLDFCGIRPGCPADLIVLDGRSVYEVLWKHELPHYVISGGKIVARNRREEDLYL